MRFHEEAAADGGSAVTVSLHTRDGAAITARAGVSATGSARLLQLEEVAIEAPLAGTLLMVRNSDVPGVVGKLGTVIGEHGINIAHLALGRAGGEAAGTAMALIQMDGEGSPALLRQLRAIEAVHEVRLLRLPV